MSYTLDSLGNVTPVFGSGGVTIDSFGNVFGSNGVQTGLKMPFGYNGPKSFGIDSFGNQNSNFEYGTPLQKFPWQK